MAPRQYSESPAQKGAATSRLAVDVVVDEARKWSALGSHDPEAVVAEVAAALAGLVTLPARLTTATVALADDAEVRRLNGAWRGLDKPTNVLSFPSPAPVGRAALEESFLGDVVLAEETLMREAVEQEIAAIDHFRHLVLHGLLHLLGYDHETDGEAEAMELLETRILAALGVADPYAGSEPVAAAAVQPEPGKAPGT